MSGRIGKCINCEYDGMGIYTMDVCRGWVSDKYNFSIEICENCVEEIAKKWNIPSCKEMPNCKDADTYYVYARKEKAFVKE